MHTCYLCGERDQDERLEYDGRKNKRYRWAHLECKEEAAYLLDDFMKYEAPCLRSK